MKSQIQILAVAGMLISAILILLSSCSIVTQCGQSKSEAKRTHNRWDPK